VVLKLSIRQGKDDNHDFIWHSEHGEQSRVVEGSSPEPGEKGCSMKKPTLPYPYQPIPDPPCGMPSMCFHPSKTQPFTCNENNAFDL